MANKLIKFTKDSIRNLYTKLGLNVEDKKTGNEYSTTQKDDPSLESAYVSSPTATKFVDQLPFDMMREGYDLVFEKTNDKIRTDLFNELERLNLNKKIEQALRWARLYNGAAIFFMFDSNTTQDKQVENIKKIEFCTVLDRTEITPETQSIEKDVTKENYGKPTLYKIKSNNSELLIHHSRLLLFTGDEAPKTLNSDSNYWGISPLSKFYDSCMAYDAVHHHTASIVEDFIQKVCKVDGYNDLLQTDEGAIALSEKMKSIRRYASLRNIVYTDKNDEYSLQSANVSGLDALVKILKDKMVSDSNMPHNIILGSQLGGGLNNDGSAESRVWYDYVVKKQESELKPILRNAINKILSQTKVFGTISDAQKSYEIVFESLWQLTQKEKAELHKLQAEADSIYLDRFVVTENEVRNSRFGDEEYSVETKLIEESAPNNIDVQE